MRPNLGDDTDDLKINCVIRDKNGVIGSVFMHRNLFPVDYQAFYWCVVHYRRGPTDGRTNKAFYRDARTHQTILVVIN